MNLIRSIFSPLPNLDYTLEINLSKDDVLVLIQKGFLDSRRTFLDFKTSFIIGDIDLSLSTFNYGLYYGRGKPAVKELDIYGEIIETSKFKVDVKIYITPSVSQKEGKIASYIISLVILGLSIYFSIIYDFYIILPIGVFISLLFLMILGSNYSYMKRSNYCVNRFKYIFRNHGVGSVPTST